jgi:hypothetical protein
MTSFSPASPVSLQTGLDSLKRRNAGQKPITNYFFQAMDKVANLRVLESPKSLCFLHDEWDFSRLYFCTYDAADLQIELQSAPWPPIVVSDWISKEGNAPVHALLENLGFHTHAMYDRIIYKTLRLERSNDDLLFAEPGDSEAIHGLLFRVFDKYADHIISLEELCVLVGQRRIILTRDAQQAIDGLVIFPINGQNCNFNFLYNSGGLLKLSRLLGNFYGVLSERGVQSGFSWVRRTRPLVLKLHESFGWKRDGIVDYIYVR